MVLLHEMHRIISLLQSRSPPFAHEKNAQSDDMNKSCEMYIIML